MFYWWVKFTTQHGYKGHQQGYFASVTMSEKISVVRGRSLLEKVENQIWNGTDLTSVHMATKQMKNSSIV